MRTLFTISAILFFPLCIYAQDFSVKEGNIPSGDIMADAWMIKLGEDLKFAQNTFKDYAKDKLDVKTKSNGKQELIAEAVNLPNLSEKRGDIKIHFTPAGDSITAGIAFVQGYDIFINAADNPEGMAKLGDFTRDFLKYYYQAYYTHTIDLQVEDLKQLKKELEKSERKISKLEKKTRKNSKKLSNENDAGKRAKYHERNGENEAEINKLSDRIPELTAEIQQLEMDIAQARNAKADINNKIDYAKIVAE